MGRGPADQFSGSWSITFQVSRPGQSILQNSRPGLARPIGPNTSPQEYLRKKNKPKSIIPWATSYSQRKLQISEKEKRKEKEKSDKNQITCIMFILVRTYEVLRIPGTWQDSPQLQPRTPHTKKEKTPANV